MVSAPPPYPPGRELRELPYDTLVTRHEQALLLVQDATDLGLPRHQVERYRKTEEQFRLERVRRARLREP